MSVPLHKGARQERLPFPGTGKQDTGAIYARIVLDALGSSLATDEPSSEYFAGAVHPICASEEVIATGVRR